MGRFYKTSKPQHIDFMYELPKEAMMKAVQTADSQIAKQEEANEALRGLLKLDAIQKDRPHANKILEGYEKQIDDLSREIQQNPLEFRRKSSKINQLQKAIHQDFTRGDAANIQSQFDTRAANYEAMKKAIEKNPELYNYADIEKLQQQLDTQYGGFQQGPYQTDRLREFVDIKDFDKFGKDYEADVIEKLGAFKGKDGYLYTSKDKTERVDPNQIKQNLVDILMNDQKLNDYYDQQIQLGNITEDEYVDLLATTADRIGEKYGYTKTSKGLTSIKGDPKAAAIAGARETYFLNNPLPNTTPGAVVDVPVLSKYETKDENGNVVDNNNIAGIDTAIGTTEKNMRLAQSSISKLAGDNNIILTDEMSKAIQNGNFAVLKNVRGEDGETIDPQILLDYQNQYDSSKFDRELLAKKKEVANQQEDPDAYLQEQRDKPGTINNINEYQSLGIVSKEQSNYFNKAIKEWRREIDGSRGYWDAPLQFDVNDMKQVPPHIQEKLQNGKSLMDLVNEGVIKTKVKVQDTGQPEMASTQGGLQYATGNTVKEQIATTEFDNFKVNGKFAKPATQLDGQGNVLVQYEIQIDGYPINVHMDESHLSNKTIKDAMDLDAMKAGHQYMEAKNEGAIDEEGFQIEGVVFRKHQGKDVAEIKGIGTVPVNEAVKMIAAKRKAKRQQLLAR